jgi:AmmeMemoRadiSam system protein A
MNRGPTLLAMARGALLQALGGPAAEERREPWLAEPGACFVTLRKDGELRGCVGSIQARRSLGEDVVENAHCAAFRDPRFSPLMRSELDHTRIEVSLLSALERLEAASEEEAIAQLRPGVDGVVLRWGVRQATFIPKMWEQLPDPATFLAYLRAKAGLPRAEWVAGTRLSRFTALLWEEQE